VVFHFVFAAGAQEAAAAKLLSKDEGRIAVYNYQIAGQRHVVRFLLPLLACLLSACATPHWVKPEASKSDLAQDQAACVHAVQQPPPSGTTDQQQYEACMNAHGWKLLQ
jgi:hypothetical protein